MSLLPFSLVATKAAYDNIATKDPFHIYVIEDTVEVYRGENPITSPVRVVEELPANPAKGVLYVKTPEYIGSVWNGTEWVPVFNNNVATTLNDTDAQPNAVSGDTLKTYIAGKIANLAGGLSYDGTTGAIKYKDGTGADKVVQLDNFIKSVTYDSASGNLSFLTPVGDPIVVNIPKDNFVKAGSYDAANKQIVLTLQNDSTVIIPVGDLVEDTAYNNTTTVKLTHDTVGKTLTADVLISQDENNSLSQKADGLFVQQVDTKVALDKAEEILTANADGSFKPSGKKVGAEALSATPDVNTVATEIAVKTAVDASAADKLSASDVLADYPNFSAPSATKVVSEKALTLSLGWDVIASVVSGTATDTATPVVIGSTTYASYEIKDEGGVQVPIKEGSIAYLKMNGEYYPLNKDGNVNLLFDASSPTATYNFEAKTLDNKLVQFVINYVKPA